MALNDQASVDYRSGPSPVPAALRDAAVNRTSSPWDSLQAQPLLVNFHSAPLCQRAVFGDIRCSRHRCWALSDSGDLGSSVCAWGPVVGEGTELITFLHPS